MHDLPSRKEIDEILEEDSKLKKILVGVSAIFLLILTTSYFLLGYPVYPIIAGNYESHYIKGNAILTERYSIVFLNEEYKNLKDH